MPSVQFGRVCTRSKPGGGVHPADGRDPCSSPVGSQRTAATATCRHDEQDGRRRQDRAQHRLHGPECPDPAQARQAPPSGQTDFGDVVTMRGRRCRRRRTGSALAAAAPRRLTRSPPCRAAPVYERIRVPRRLRPTPRHLRPAFALGGLVVPLPWGVRLAEIATLRRRSAWRLAVLGMRASRLLALRVDATGLTLGGSRTAVCDHDRGRAVGRSCGPSG